MLVVHNPEMLGWIRPRYTAEQIRELREFLRSQGTFQFPQFSSGLFRAALSAAPEFDYTGYSAVWVRDNVHLANALFVTGEHSLATRAALGLMRFYAAHEYRLRDVLDDRADPWDAMQRPHIRFDGETLRELPVKWAHAQNDALGGFLWLFCRLALAGHLWPTGEHFEVLAGFVHYLERIEFWQDEDSGHWEEARKVGASSIGAVAAGLRAATALFERLPGEAWSFDGKPVTHPQLSALRLRADAALAAILPAECRQPPPKDRRYDSALLFLAYPLEIVTGEIRDQIVSDVLEHLAGPYGIRRYRGDSYWCADYKQNLAAELRAADVSDDMSARDRLLKEGMEAQWCLFDPIVSVIFGLRFREAGDPRDLSRQVHHLNRSLGQLTGPETPFGPYRCPESYYAENGRYVPNDVTPLLWTQANLLLALHHLEETLSLPQGA